MTIGNAPAEPLAEDEEVSYTMSDGSTATIRGLEPDRWELIAPRFTAEILRDGAIYRTRTHIEGVVVMNVAPDWVSVFTLIYR